MLLCAQWLTAGRKLTTLSGFSEREVNLNVHEHASGSWADTLVHTSNNE
jgi:hypothetical protein